MGGLTLLLASKDISSEPSMRDLIVVVTHRNEGPRPKPCQIWPNSPKLGRIWADFVRHRAAMHHKEHIND